MSHASDGVKRVLGSVNSLIEHFNMMHGRETARSLSLSPLASVVKLVLTIKVDINPILRVVGVRVGIASDFPEGSILIKVLEKDETAPRLLLTEGFQFIISQVYCASMDATVFEGHKWIIVVGFLAHVLDHSILDVFPRSQLGVSIFVRSINGKI